MATDNVPSENELINQLLAGDERAFRRIVQEYNGMMVYLARSIVGEAIADEVAQESWLAVIRALPKFERRSSLKTWILRIVSNTAKSRLRHESRKINVDFEGSDDEAIDPTHFNRRGHWQNPPHMWHADTPEAILASDELRNAINGSLTKLPPLQLATVVLRDMQGMDMESICKILDISESNGRVLLHRARSQLRETIDDFQGKR